MTCFHREESVKYSAWVHKRPRKREKTVCGAQRGRHIFVRREHIMGRIKIMRLTPLISAILVFSISGPLFAQEWIEFASREDRFTCNFPTQPKIAQTTYVSQHEAELPARIYSATQGQSRYSVTVVDYTQAQRILTEKAKSCPAGAEPCLGGPGDEGHWKSDIRGAMDYAAWQLMKRDAKLTLFLWSNVDQVEGHQLQLTNNAYRSQTF